MFKQRALSTTILSAILVSAAGAGAALAQEGGLEQITVTATKRAASAQSIPLAVNAMPESTLEELRVDVFTDYLQQLPGVTAGGSGPGQSTIYIRGLASTTPNLTTAGVAGLAPNVAFYLDEQPLAQPGRNLDVYAADLQRIEVLPGPQGTLFGSSSQAGTVRLITNRPVMGEYGGGVNFGLSSTEGGDMSHKFEAVLNVPVAENIALRGVLYTDTQGGYIDNVAGTINASESARFRPAGTVRANGVPVSAGRAGFQAGSDLSGVTFLDADNAALVEDDFNETKYQGFRISALADLNTEWSLLVSHTQQQMESEGVFFEDPELGDLEIQRYADDLIEDDFSNTSWTLEGRLGMLDVVYTGAYTDRETTQTVDYTDYLFVGQYLPYYICDVAVTYPGAAAPSGTCNAPNLFVDSRTNTTVETHEFRFNTPEDNRWRLTAGAFYSNLELAELNDFTYPGSIPLNFAPNYPLTNTAVTGAIGNASPGYFSDAGPFPEGVIFRNDVLRTDEQMGFFGELTFDVSDEFSVTLGARHYDIEVDLEGSANSSFGNLGAATDAQIFGTNISAQFAPGNTVGAPDKAATDGMIFKLTGTWTPQDNLLFYATYSEGFRPGLLNRPGGASGPGGYTVPYALDTDDVQNYEFGWKTDLFDNTLRFNGSAFFVEIENLQTTIFDPSIVNLFFSDNAANAEIRGVEGDVTWVPETMPGLTVSGAFSILDTEITEVLTPTNDVIAGSELAFAPGFQANIRARYEWEMENGWMAHVMPQIVHSDDSVSDVIEINKARLDGYTMGSFSTGVTEDNWRVELFIDNITDERAQLSNNFVFDRERVTIARPRTWGVRVGVDF
ncbi:TonB-dependent receptor [Maricaulis sp.]|uniref:TonB-dependent receptor n=1 Tax=Maricaulis sp. TaxID=1486257 RepID=UPI002635DCC0|nr:TonB-dependent receptor [Maricaulis sp.]